MQKLTAAIPDALIVVGGVSVAFGAWILHPAAGFITGGAIAITFGIMAAKVKADARAAARAGVAE
jgi:hypothetical protein